MRNDYVLLTEQEEMWAKMLTEVLEDNHIPCATLPVYGAGFSIKTGVQERLKVFVPAHLLTQAEELLQMLFSASFVPEEEE